MKARVTYFFGGIWLWECADPKCPAIEFADSAALAGDDARAHMAEHHAPLKAIGGAA
jgi:hypothetical protein